jgi:hypothetical protein
VTIRGCWKLCLVLLLAMAAMLHGQPLTAHPYYPLSIGNAWSYVVQSASHGGDPSTVEWKVTAMNKARSGRRVYQVWPTPMQADDEAMQLEVSENGLVEISSKVLVLRSSLKQGDEWTWTRPGASKTPGRVFRVRSVGLPCVVGSGKYVDCAVVEDVDQQTRLRTVTTYAKGFGPIEYRSFRMNDKGRPRAVQTVTLKSCHLVP